MVPQLQVQKSGSFLPKLRSHQSPLKYGTTATKLHDVISEGRNLKNNIRCWGENYVYYYNAWGARSGAVGWGTALEAERFQVRFPMVSLAFFIDITLTAAYGAGVDLACNECQEYFLGVKAAGRGADITNLMCRMSRNMESLTSS
jgi:hypothetical protein